jgi:cytochrome b6-f complex iron-sulfur subunit
VGRKRSKRDQASGTGKRTASGADAAPQPVVAPPASPPRRRLLGWIWGGLLAALAAEILWVIGSFLRPRGSRAGESMTVVVAGPVDRFAPDSVTAFPGGKFYLARLADGGFLALDRTCTHLGCTVPWDAETARFNCPCHASSFDITGAVLAPPAPRPLDLFLVRIENGIVKVDTGRRERRETFEPSQVARV